MVGIRKRQSRAAAKDASAIRYCAMLPRVVPPVPSHLVGDPLRASAILSSQSKWVNGTVLHYGFFGAGSRYAAPKTQADAVRNAFSKWEAVGIGLKFTEVTDLNEAEVRIGYSVSDGESSSMVGREILKVPSTEPTTVYGWDLTSPYGSGTALHELGHVIGMEHEHQSPFAGIQWNEAAVYASLGGPPNNWSRATTYHNILEKLSPQQVQGSKWDPDSIMEYEFEPGLIVAPKPYDTQGINPPGKLSAADQQWALKWYPPQKAALQTLQPFESATADLASGQQMDFAVKPTASRKYTLETKGAADTVMVLFEDHNGEARYLAGDDDSDSNRNAKISYKLFKDRNYIVRLRTLYPGPTGRTSIMYS
jgi:hypothetical protein